MSERKSRGRFTLLSPFKRLILLILSIVLIVSMYFGIKALNEKETMIAKKSMEIDDIKSEIVIEESKANDIKNQDGNASDKEYEEMARDDLGLIKKDEIVIKPR